MRLADFQSMVERLKGEVPPQYLNGIVDIAVSPKSVPHPLRGDVYTLGECVPLEWSGTGADLQSRVVIYHGSFAALAALGDPGDFDWRTETWETLTHELRHHLEWRANIKALEAYDWAAEQNFARHEGDPFDPAFYKDGESLGPTAYKVEDDIFLEMTAPAAGHPLQVEWHGRRYEGLLPADFGAPAFVTLEGLTDPPPGDAVAVIRGRRSLTGWLRRHPIRSSTITLRALDG